MTGPKVLLPNEPSRGIDGGMTVVIIIGEIDLSMGSVVGLTSMIAGWFVRHGIDPGLGGAIQINTFEIIVLVCFVGTFVGWT